MLSAIDPYLAALKLPNTPLQKLRLSLTAGSLLTSLGRPQEAYDLYKKLLDDYPDYPGKRELYERLARVAQRLNKQEEAVEFQRLSKEG